MQPLVAELGYINGLLKRADAGELHLPEGVTEAVDDDFQADPEDVELGRSRSIEPDVYLFLEKERI